jgi:pimeloyl-ACP methyl ester carboxylesterase
MTKLRVLFSASIVLILLLSNCNNLFQLPENSIDRKAANTRLETKREYYDTEETLLYMETGTLGPGAKYTIVLPPGWQNQPENEKKLVLYAHGYVPKGMPSDYIQTNSESIEYFVGVKKYAIAFSNYSENGWAVKDGTIRTRQLRNYFLDNIGTADKIYLYGVSEGALIAVKLAEQNPDLFSGVLAFAGPLGGAKFQFEYIMNARLVFDYFFKEKVRYAAAVLGIPEAVSLSYSLGYNLTDPSSDRSVFEAIPDPVHYNFIDPMTFLLNMIPLVYNLIPEDEFIPDIQEIYLEILNLALELEIAS